MVAVVRSVVDVSRQQDFSRVCAEILDSRSESNGRLAGLLERPLSAGVEGDQAHFWRPVRPQFEFCALCQGVGALLRNVAARSEQALQSLTFQCEIAVDVSGGAAPGAGKQ
ncbi:hypothetical protein ABT301_22525 [Streptomyces sp. NPDC000987]|uniref:hypothetical protein n=1 Tax=Streptomyces sp. NPDC000987 TaxID=3154374 RepID=UPI0033242930